MKMEVGREMKVSELKPHTIVCVHKLKWDVVATMWVVDVGKFYVEFWAGENKTGFLALRCGPDLEQITDDSHEPFKVYEYLGEP